jgi:hypothetical protein
MAGFRNILITGMDTIVRKVLRDGPPMVAKAMGQKEDTNAGLPGET